jgi:hypothetical protein
VTLEALLTLIGILVAVLALVRPVQRRSLALFVPMWLLPAAILLSLALIVCRDAPFGVSPPFGWPLSVVLFSLTMGAFLIPVGAAVWSWATWDGAKLTPKKIGTVEAIFQAALREHEFDEVERIVRKNQQNLQDLPASAATVLFNPTMVSALVDSHSLVLELLANMRFLQSLENRLAAVEAVVRELLRSNVSPLRSAVVSRYGGLEHVAYSDSERALMEKTFRNPEWYFEANAHYPLTISAVEELRSGKFDSDYNNVGRDYEASQGISSRAYCPVYLALKTEVLAIEAAIEAKIEKDFYVTDLWNLFRAVKERSRFNTAIWQSSMSNDEHPTPYAYLLHLIAADLRDLSAKAIQVATSTSAPPQGGAPSRIAHDLAMTWSYCVWCIADSQNQASPQFRNGVIQSYLLFMLALGWGPSEIYVGAGRGAVGGLDAWRDLFLRELNTRFAADSARKGALADAFNSLDQGKRFVFDGSTWLKPQLFGNP